VDSGLAAVQLRDLFPEPPEPGSVPSCADAGVLGALCGQVGSLMAVEAVKLITGIGRPLLGRVLVLDALEQRWTEIPLIGAPPVEPPGPDPGAGLDRAPRPGALAPAAQEVSAVSADELAALLDGASSGSAGVHVVDVREAAERAAGAIPGSVPIPLGRLLTGDGLAALPDGPIVLVCHAGIRSEVAGRFLLGAGRREVVHLDGGMLSWRGALTSGDEVTG